jgi:hypothetical protein
MKARLIPGRESRARPRWGFLWTGIEFTLILWGLRFDPKSAASTMSPTLALVLVLIVVYFVWQNGKGSCSGFTATSKGPATSGKSPATSGKSPATSVKSPAATVKIPAATVKIPAASVKIPAATVKKALGCVLDAKLKPGDPSAYPALTAQGYCAAPNFFSNNHMVPLVTQTVANCAKSCDANKNCNAVVWNTHNGRCIHYGFPNREVAGESAIHDGTGDYLFATRNATATRPFSQDLKELHLKGL